VVWLALRLLRIRVMSASATSPLYHPDFEHDACGVGFIAKLTGERSHDLIDRALAALTTAIRSGSRPAPLSPVP